MIIQLMMLARISRKSNNYLYKEQFKDLYDGMKPAILIFIGTWWINVFALLPLFKLFIQGVVAFAIVIVYTEKSTPEGYDIIKNLWRQAMKKDVKNRDV